MSSFSGVSYEPSAIAARIALTRSKRMSPVDSAARTASTDSVTESCTSATPCCMAACVDCADSTPFKAFSPCDPCVDVTPQMFI